MKQEKEKEKRKEKEKEETKKREEKIVTRSPTEKEKGKEKETKKGGVAEDTSVEETVPLTPDEKLLLKYLVLLQNNNKTDIGITGFQAKDAFEEIFPEKNVDENYANLKKRGFLSDRKDTKEFNVQKSGRDKAKELEEQSEKILKEVEGFLREKIKENELLRRLLWLSYQDRDEFRHYFSEITHL